MSYVDLSNVDVTDATFNNVNIDHARGTMSTLTQIDPNYTDQTSRQQNTPQILEELQVSASVVNDNLATDAVNAEGELAPEWHDTPIGRAYLDARADALAGQIKEQLGEDVFDDEGNLIDLWRDTPIGRAYLDARADALAQQDTGRYSEEETIQVADFVRNAPERARLDARADALAGQIKEQLGEDVFDDEGNLIDLWRDTPIGRAYLDARADVAANAENDLTPDYTKYTPFAQEPPSQERTRRQSYKPPNTTTPKKPKVPRKTPKSTMPPYLSRRESRPRRRKA